MEYIVRHDVFELLISKGNIDRWMDWISALIDKYLKRYTPVSIFVTRNEFYTDVNITQTSINDANHYLARSKQLLLKWSFYTSLIMKDLTLQQARSFGSFHSLKLFLDDYILYLVEENIAQVNYALMHQQQQSEDSSSANYFVSSPVTTPSDRSTH